MDWDTRVGCYAWVERDGAVLLSHWSGGRTDDGRVIRAAWSLVGGGLELGETPERTVVREVWEESGYDVAVGPLLTSQGYAVAAHDRARQPGRALQIVQVVFRAEVVSGELRVERDGSSDDVRWVPLAELDTLPCASVVDVAWRAAGGPGLRQPPLRGVPVDEGHVGQVRELIDASAPRRGDVRVVAIDGLSGSGKTSLATALARDLRAPLVQMDDLYPGWDGLAASPALLAQQVLEPLARGERAAYRRWDWHAGDWATEPVEVAVEPGGVLVVEGCGSSVGPAGEHAAVRVWVDAEPGLRMRRGVARDGEAYRPHWERWAAQEEQVFGADRTRERADMVIDTTPARASR